MLVVVSKNILITGGAGFIGSHLVKFFVNKYPNYNIFNLDSLTYASDINSLNLIQDSANYKFIKGDICEVKLVENIFKEFQITDVIHLAAETHVDNSINSAGIFIKTNIEGTFTLLEISKKFWLSDNHGNRDNRFLHVSTDEVYGSLGPTGYFDEASNYAPNSPYSASKAASDLLCRSYYKTYNLPVIISNCSNNFGPYQHAEKFIPTIIRKALAGAEIPIYGNGLNIRDWLYVEDHCLGLDSIFHSGRIGEKYCLGSPNELANIDIAIKICRILDILVPKIAPYEKQLEFVIDRLGHDFRYAINYRKMQDELNWQPIHDFDDALKQTITYYVDKKL